MLIMTTYTDDTLLPESTLVPRSPPRIRLLTLTWYPSSLIQLDGARHVSPLIPHRP